MGSEMCIRDSPLPGQALPTLLALPVCFLGFSTEHGLGECSELLVCLYEPQGWVLCRQGLIFFPSGCASFSSNSGLAHSSCSVHGSCVTRPWLELYSSILCVVTSGRGLTVPGHASTNHRFRHYGFYGTPHRLASWSWSPGPVLLP